MANPWRKVLSSFLSIVLVAGLLPCASFYGSAWASDAKSEGSAVEAAQVEEGASTAIRPYLPTPPKPPSQRSLQLWLNLQT